MRNIFLAVTCAVSWSAESPDLPKPAFDAVEKSKTANAKTFLVWKQAVEKDRVALTKTLEGILASESKKKNNDATVAAIKAKLDELKKDDWIAAAIKEQSADADDLLGEMMTEKEVLAAISGVWFVAGNDGVVMHKLVYDGKAKTVTMFLGDKLTKVIPEKPSVVEPLKLVKVNDKWIFNSVWSSTVEFKTNAKMELIGSNAFLSREK